jgi:20S proteasome alpha/beta subunit
MSIEEAFQLLRDALMDIIDVSNDNETDNEIRHIAEDVLLQTEEVGK